MAEVLAGLPHRLRKLLMQHWCASSLCFSKARVSLPPTPNPEPRTPNPEPLFPAALYLIPMSLRTIALPLLAAASLLAQPKPQPQDEEFARLVKEWTTRPEFMSPLVDH